MQPISVLVVDDHPALRGAVLEVLSRLEDFEVVGEASDGAQGVEMARALHPQVVIMDLNMPGMGGLAATSILNTELPSSRILIFTASETEADLSTALQYGAIGFILKSATAEDLVQAVQHVAQGGVIISPTLGRQLLGEFKVAPEPGVATDGLLSPREVEVLQQIGGGATNKEISAALFISENTVKTHARNIMDKLHLANRSQAAAHAARVGLLGSPEPRSPSP